MHVKISKKKGLISTKKNKHQHQSKFLKNMLIYNTIHLIVTLEFFKYVMKTEKLKIVTCNVLWYLNSNMLG